MFELIWFFSGVGYITAGIVVCIVLDDKINLLSSIESVFLTFVVVYVWPIAVPIAFLISKFTKPKHFYDHW